MASSPSPSWVILGSVPRVCAADADLPKGADLSLALAAPPRLTLLTIPRRVAPDPVAPRSFPSVLAADPSGLLLLHASQGRTTTADKADNHGRQILIRGDPVEGYFVADACTATAFRLPDPALGPGPVGHHGNLGLLPSPRGCGHYMIVELQPDVDFHEATLLCFSSYTGEWVHKTVDYPLPCRPRPWGSNGVIAHQGKLWWVDLYTGLLSCDTFAVAKERKLHFIPLPKGKELEEYPVYERDLDRSRCVKVSDGNMRFVDITGGRVGAPVVSMWTLAADPGAEEWTPEYEASFAEVWADESYKATGLPEKTPVLALVHPKNPDVVYFSLEELLFGVDMRAKKVVECEAYQRIAPSGDAVSSRYVHAWELPRVLSSGPTEDQTEECSSVLQHFCDLV